MARKPETPKSFENQCNEVPLPVDNQEAAAIQQQQQHPGADGVGTRKRMHQPGGHYNLRSTPSSVTDTKRPGCPEGISPATKRSQPSSKGKPAVAKKPPLSCSIVDCDSESRIVEDEPEPGPAKGNTLGKRGHSANLMSGDTSKAGEQVPLSSSYTAEEHEGDEEHDGPSKPKRRKPN